MGSLLPQKLSEIFELRLVHPGEIYSLVVYRKNGYWCARRFPMGDWEFDDIAPIKRALKSKDVQEKLAGGWSYQVRRTVVEIIDRSLSPLEQLADCAE